MGSNRMVWFVNMLFVCKQQCFIWLSTQCQHTQLTEKTRNNHEEEKSGNDGHKSVCLVFFVKHFLKNLIKKH